MDEFPNVIRLPKASENDNGKGVVFLPCPSIQEKDSTESGRKDGVKKDEEDAVPSQCPTIKHCFCSFAY